MRGDAVGLYGPADPITMGQLAKIALRLADADVPAAKNGEVWHAPHVRTAASFGLSAFKVRTDGNALATRGAVVMTLLEAMDFPIAKGTIPYSDVAADSKYAAAIATATQLGIVSGDDGKTTFRPDAPVNRAEVAKMVIRALQVRP